MTQDFTYTGLLPEWERQPSKVVGVYLWMHEYCHHYLKDNPEVTKVKLTLDGGTHAAHMEGKVYEFKQPKQEEAKIIKLHPKR